MTKDEPFLLEILIETEFFPQTSQFAFDVFGGKIANRSRPIVDHRSVRTEGDFLVVSPNDVHRFGELRSRSTFADETGQRWFRGDQRLVRSLTVIFSLHLCQPRPLFASNFFHGIEKNGFS